MANSTTSHDWFSSKFKPDERCESPMEELFSTAFQAVRRLSAVHEALKVSLVAQRAAGAYRLDFAIEDAGTVKPYRIAVEIDGHEFHDRTKEQASRDRKRDRELQMAGWQVFRFTGSDINRNPFAAAEQVLDSVYLAHFGRTAKSDLTARNVAKLQSLLSE